MKDKKSDWLNYEELACSIYAKLEPKSLVKHNDKIYGHISERPRQIDVSIRSSIGGHEILVIVEAKDRNRAPDVSIIDGFAKKMDDVSASRGVIVCRKKPSQDNLIYASKYGIDICTAIDINDYKWKEQILIPVIVQAKEYYVDLEPQITLAGDTVMNHPNTWQVSLDKGKTNVLLREYILDLIRNSNPNEGNWQIAVKPNTLTIFLGGGTWNPFELKIHVSSRIKKVFRYCAPSEYIALRNYSNQRTIISDIKLDLPDLGNNDEWVESDKVSVKNPETFIAANVAFGQLGLFGKEFGKGDLIDKNIRYFQRIPKSKINKKSS